MRVAKLKTVVKKKKKKDAGVLWCMREKNVDRKKNVSLYTRRVRYHLHPTKKGKISILMGKILSEIMPK